MSALAAYRALLANRPLSLLLGGEFVSAIGDWLYMVAILIVIYRETNDPVIVGLFGALRALPYVILSIPAGYLADRVDRRLVLLGTDVFRGLCMLVMAWIVATDGPVALLVLLAVLATCSSTFFYPAIGAYIPNLVRDERELGPANSLWATLDNLGYIIGPALGGILVAVGGAVFAFLANAATFLVIVAVLWRLPPSSNVAHAAEPVASPVAGPDPGLVRDPQPALVAVGDPESAAPIARPSPRIPLAPIGGLLLVAAVLYAFDGGLGILTVVLATDVLGAGEAATGFLTAAVGIGGVIGGIVSGGLLLRRRLGPPLLIGAVVGAAALVLLSNATVLAAAMVGLGMYAFGYFLVDVVVTTLLQRVLPDAARGRGVGLLMTVGTLGEVVGSLALPVLVSTLGTAILAPASLILVGAAIVGLRLIGPAATRAPTEAEATLIRVVRNPLFSGIGAPAIERALGRLRTLPIAAGQVVVHQGEPADQFYLVQGGTFAVTQRDTGG
ncbi:MAG TPA: MFS transporter, partial [Candidatus Limnocylindrales bacterium]